MRIDYTKTFANLCHIKALSHENKFEEIIKKLILYAICQNAKSVVKNENDLIGLINKSYGIKIRNSVILPCIDKLLHSKDIVRNPSTKQYLVSSTSVSSIQQRIEETKNIEKKVKENWEEELLENEKNIPKKEFGVLWGCLQTYLSLVFEQHGVQTAFVLNPNAKISEKEQKGLQTLAKEALTIKGNPIELDLFIFLVNQFIMKADEMRAAYIAQLADSTFTCYALSCDIEINSFLNNRFNGMQLFLDTNFIFGLLNLHNNKEDTSAIEILTEINNGRIKLNLVYHPYTLSEFISTLNFKSDLIKKTQWTRATSRIALTCEDLSPIELSYHLKNSEEEVDPTLFFEKYNHVDLILKELGLTEYKNFRNISDEEYSEIEIDIDSFEKFYKSLNRSKPKTYIPIRHDITLLREVRLLSKKKSKFFDCAALLLSSDYILAKFDKDYYKKSNEISLVISPSVFLQLIRPFINSDFSSNKRFIETFSISEFRSFDIDYSVSKSRALQIINDNFHGISDETKVNILRDEILLGKLSNASKDYQKQVEIIENKISIKNSLLTVEKDNIEQQLLTAKKENEALNESYLKLQQKLMDLNSENLKAIEFENNTAGIKESDNLPDKSEIPIFNSSANKIKMDKTKILLAAIALLLILFVVYKIFESKRSSELSISSDGATLKVGDDRAPTSNADITIKRITLTGTVKINSKHPQPGVLDYVCIKGDNEVPRNPLNDDAYILKNVTLPAERMIEIEFIFKDGWSYSRQIAIFEIDTNRNLVKIPLIDIPYSKKNKNGSQMIDKQTQPPIEIHQIIQTGNGEIKDIKQ
jgi:hypothetical protein